MQIWPAIDIARGKCVRLQQGDFARETVFGDPLESARHWLAEGAECLHLVDLDGARTGSPQQLELAARIAQESAVPCQLGGGLRTYASVESALRLGIARVVLGTAALTANNDWLDRALESHPGRIAIGIDVRDGRVAVQGWTETTPLTPIQVARRFERSAAAALVVTDVGADGMLQGPNWEFLQAVRDAVSIPLIASGGVTTEQDIDQLARLGFAGVIVGRALYEGTLSMAGALAAARRVSADRTNASDPAGC